MKVQNDPSPSRSVETTEYGSQLKTLQARHRRSGRITDAITRVLSDHGSPMQAKAIHAAVEALLEQPVRLATVKALLAANVGGTSPRFQRVARGQYRTGDRRR